MASATATAMSDKPSFPTLASEHKSIIVIEALSRSEREPSTALTELL